MLCRAQVEPGTLAQFRRLPSWVSLETSLYSALCDGELGRALRDMSRDIVDLIADYASPWFALGDELNVRAFDGVWRRAFIVYLRKLPAEKSLTGLSERALVRFATQSNAHDEWVGLLTDTDRVTMQPASRDDKSTASATGGDAAKKAES